MKKTESSSYGARYEQTYTYKSDGITYDKVFRTDYTPNNKKRTEIEMSWNANGIHTSTKRKVYNPTTGKQDRFCNYVYDKNGVKLREEITYYDSKGKKAGNNTITFTQRADGSYASS